MKAPNKKQTPILLLTILLLIGTVLSPFSVFANTGSNLRTQINQLESEIQANEAHAHDLEHRARTLEQELNVIKAEISRLNKQIKLTDLKIQELEEKLEETRAELERQKEILANSIRELYKNGNVSTIEMIASSDSLTDFFNEQEYLERVKVTIYESSLKVAEYEELLEEQKAEQEKLRQQLAAQKQAQEELKAEQQELLRRTRGEQARYERYVRDLEAKQSKVQKQLDAWLRENQGNYVSYGRVNKGEVVGYTGSTGHSYGPHLHLEIITSDGSSRTNPLANEGPSCYQYGPSTNCQLIRNYIWPYLDTSWRLESPYGWRSSTGSYHRGIDIAGPHGEPIRAVADGNIICSPSSGCDESNGSGWGNYVIVYHDDGYYSLYAHMR